MCFLVNAVFFSSLQRLSPGDKATRQLQIQRDNISRIDSENKMKPPPHKKNLAVGTFPKSNKEKPQKEEKLKPLAHKCMTADFSGGLVMEVQ